MAELREETAVKGYHSGEVKIWKVVVMKAVGRYPLILRSFEGTWRVLIDFMLRGIHTDSSFFSPQLTNSTFCDSAIR